jgi:hypothetical protein
MSSRRRVMPIIEEKSPPREHVYTLRLSEEERRELARLSTDEGRVPADVVRRALRLYAAGRLDPVDRSVEHPD